MEDRAELIRMQRVHWQAARRLRVGALTYPAARKGLERCAAFHVARAATLAIELTVALAGVE